MTTFSFTSWALDLWCKIKKILAIESRRLLTEEDFLGLGDKHRLCLLRYDYVHHSVLIPIQCGHNKAKELLLLGHWLLEPNAEDIRAVDQFLTPDQIDHVLTKHDENAYWVNTIHW